MTNILSIGIDPGIKNFGFAIVQKTEPYKVRSFFNSTFTIDAKDGLPIKESLCLVNSISEIIHANVSVENYSEIHLGIERFVSYGHVHSSSTESITMLIGMLVKQLDLIFPGIRDSVNRVSLNMPRAYEWKNSLVKTLAKNTSFDNPSGTLDKGFSLAAAKFISENPNGIKTDHEADAICIASYKILG